MKLRKPSPDKGKKVGINEAETISDYNRESPTFCLRYIRPDYCISKCTKDEKAAFADKLREMSAMTWMQLLLARRHGAGLEKISRDSIRAGLPNHLTDDVDIIAFRFDGLKAMVGYRKKGMFHIIGLDRDFSFYKH